MSEIRIHTKVWVSDDSFEASLSCPVTATKEQFEALAQGWIKTLQAAIDTAWNSKSALHREEKP